MPQTVIVGIINCTPDSFSDGVRDIDDVNPTGRERSTARLLDKARALLDAGAQMLDVGGDSTRPGSRCTNDQVEWTRIEPILSHFCHRVPVSVDTHKAEVARRALDVGAAMINDVTGGIDPILVETVAGSSALYTYMFNAYGAAHTFEQPHTCVSPDDVITTVSRWAAERARTLATQGIHIERQIVDPGLGGFVSPDPAVSQRIVEDFWRIESPCSRRMLGCSRKGFLRQPLEMSPADRDEVSALLGARVATAAPSESTLYIRVHNAMRQSQTLRNHLTQIGAR
jgi:dihydropteroate synthase